MDNTYHEARRLLTKLLDGKSAFTTDDRPLLRLRIMYGRSSAHVIVRAGTEDEGNILFSDALDVRGCSWTTTHINLKGGYHTYELELVWKDGVKQTISVHEVSRLEVNEDNAVVWFRKIQGGDDEVQKKKQGVAGA
ncbi:MAG: hypothetical protein GWO20_00605 [Candidatus Korarchaeota archaeon]|nr:hypothetical protein [Candidatus Korarchaeota archaeon]